ncbi:hypothetical protein M409DRAFT_29105 [Zasmidium cellare ATCC 36951]|uniref:Selenoprotein W-like protein n=1 Tax=Zasmidium cellare ATCC 36951 TaxID=1080233 RepID=A0A6A6C0A6_ZASCE|nr:uncharacterized protein M409DRAFT_29105 [Zasmidium cellare ATCC 36951]KAF2160484.1 hypothetical protein M409DRAFT_29105 [Zasmidium cellare ATCC 36951]
MSNETSQSIKLPRVAITYCTQCKWMLRAAYFGQELLSTFGTSIGEIALIPATGGIFTVYLTYQPPTSNTSDQVETKEVLLWDRKAEGGFPETKVLKQRVRNHIEPDKNLGHSDTPSSKVKANTTLEGDVVVKPDDSEVAANAAVVQKDSEGCKDCP